MQGINTFISSIYISFREGDGSEKGQTSSISSSFAFYLMNFKGVAKGNMKITSD